MRTKAMPKKQAITPEEMRTIAEAIAKTINVPTLEVRNSDSLDFYDVAVWNLEKIINIAFLMGVKSMEK